MKALQLFLTQMYHSESVLVDQLDQHLLSAEEITNRVKHSVVNIFEERCRMTKRRKAVWMFNRETGKAEITSFLTRGK